jgi:VanZ family protein
MINKIAAVSAWVLLAAIAFATLSPIDLRPQTGHDIAERVLPFAALGAAFGVGYPRRLLFGVTITLAAAIGLEAAQLLAPGRHARLIDACEKLAGGLLGVTLAAMWLALSARLQKAMSRS